MCGLILRRPDPFSECAATSGTPTVTCNGSLGADLKSRRGTKAKANPTPAASRSFLRRMDYDDMQKASNEMNNPWKRLKEWNKERRRIERWERVRQKGKVRFVSKFGLLLGVFMPLFNTAREWISTNGLSIHGSLPPKLSGEIINKGIVGLITGLIVGASLWSDMEQKYKVSSCPQVF